MSQVSPAKLESIRQVNSKQIIKDFGIPQKQMISHSFSGVQRNLLVVIYSDTSSQHGHEMVHLKPCTSQLDNAVTMQSFGYAFRAFHALLGPEPLQAALCMACAV